MTLKPFYGLLFCLLSLGGCLKANKVVAPESNAGQADAAPVVTLALAKTMLTDLAPTAEQLELQALRVVDGEVAEATAGSWKFPISEAGLYTIEGLPAGEAEIRVSVLDGNRQLLATGRQRLTLKSGPQTLSELKLQAERPTALALDLRVTLQLLGFPEAEPLAEPEAVRAIFKKYACQGCHNSGDKPSAGIDLLSFPYKSQDKRSFSQILARVSDSVWAVPGVTKMPQGRRELTIEERTVVRDYRDAVQAAVAEAEAQWVQEVRLRLTTGAGEVEQALVLQDGTYRLQDLIQLRSGAAYPYSITVLGKDGSILQESQGTLQLPADGIVNLSLDVNHQAAAAPGGPV